MGMSLYTKHASKEITTFHAYVYEGTSFHDSPFLLLSVLRNTESFSFQDESYYIFNYTSYCQLTRERRPHSDLRVDKNGMLL